ncbi:MAG TPA: ribosomal protein S18-alanine N-acetyltransferase [Longimicrobiaceae bacterium]|nr:ribosomal protein S18-alanine N-acetyltransferase [Longimicrobiaceae bacterium]
MSTEPGPALRLRTLTPADLDAVLEIERASFTTPWRSSTFEGLLDRTDTDAVAAVVDDRVVGYSFSWTIIDQAELGNVAVAPALRGRGIGRRLVENALQGARKRGAVECFLEVRPSNRAAQALYDALGFETVGRRPHYYSRPVEDALVMRARL